MKMVGDIIGYILLGLLVAFWIFLIIWLFKLGIQKVKGWNPSFRNIRTKLQKPRKPQKRVIAPEPKLLQDIRIKQRFGFGTELIGKQMDGEFREVSLGDSLYASKTFVEYLFLTAFYIPIWPKECLRIKRYYTQDGFSIDAREAIIGREIPKTGELISIYLVRGLICLPFIIAFSPVILIHDIVEKKDG